MPKYIIERTIPELGAMTPDQLRAVSQRSCSILRDMGPQIQWLHSYATPSKLYCIYIAPSEAEIRDHAARGGFPADCISRIDRTIDPTTAE